MKTTLHTIVLKTLLDLQQQGQLPAELDLASKLQIDRTRDPKHGDFACNIAMMLAKPCQRKPRELAEQIAAAIPKDPMIVNVAVANPGFINFTLAEQVFTQVVSSILSQGVNYGQLTLGKGERVHIELVSANPTGPLHVGHGRLAAYGASLSNLLEAAGYQVHREYYVNDAGRQMRILAASVWLRYLEAMGENLPFPSRGYKGDYIRDIAKELKVSYGSQFHIDPQLVFQGLPEDDEEHCEQYIDQIVQRAENLLGVDNFKLVFDKGLQSILQDIHDDLKEFGVTCQAWFNESQLLTNGDIERGREKIAAGNYLYEQNGAIWFRSTDFGDEKDRVVIRENGQPTYFASDIGYHLNKLERGFDHLIDVYGADHHGYIPRLSALIQALGYDVKKLQVLLVQFAILYRGKTRVSMSTRGGEFVTLRELRQEVGNDAARFFYIMRRREQHLDFDLELAKSQSSDNPVYYIQYAHARICSVFRQLEQKGWQWDRLAGEQSLQSLNSVQEQNLLRNLSRYPEVIELAAQSYEPSVIAHYLQELAQDFHAYYNACPFLVEDEQTRNARLCLIAAARQVLLNGLVLLGLSAPEIM